jgi:putative hydrolase of the HAD superfamily
MIKAVIFDFGNVICKFTNEILLGKISTITGKPKEEIRNLIYEVSELPKKFETGLISSNEFFEEISKLCGLNISYDELRKIYTENKFTPIPKMDLIIQSLKPKYKLALLSNTSEWDFEYGVKIVPEMKFFDTITLSYEVKAMKPDLKIFYDALNKLNLPPEECVYTDDILEYVQAANSIGINGIHFTNPDNFLSSLKEIENKINE